MGMSLGGKIMKQITVVEIMLTYISVGWAYVLFSSPRLFDNSSNWEKIEAFANYEWVLGLITLICALVKIVGITLHNNRLRWLGLMMSTVLWIIVATSFLIADDTFKLTTGFIAYSGIAVMSLWTSKEVMMNDRAE